MNGLKKVKRLAVSASIWTLVEYISFPFLFFISAKAITSRLSPEDAGSYFLLFVFVSVGAYFSSGLGTPILIRSSRLDRTSRLDSHLATAIVLAAIGVPAVALGGYYIVAILFAKTASAELFLRIWPVLVLILSLDAMDVCVASALRGQRRYRQLAVVEFFTRLVMFSAVTIFSIRENFAAILVSIVVGYFVRFLGKIWILEARLPTMSFTDSGDFVWRQVLGNMPWALMLTAGGLSITVLDRFTVSNAIGLGALPSYALASQLAQQVHALSAASLSSTLQRFNQTIGGVSITFAVRRARFYRLLRTNFLVSTALLLLLSALGYFYLVKFQALFVGSLKSVFSNYGIHLGFFYVLALSSVPHYANLALGYLKPLAMLNFLSGIIAAAIIIAFAKEGPFLAIHVARYIFSILIVFGNIALFHFWQRIYTR